MSKIFEALQRAQQAGNAPSDPFAEPPPAPQAEAPAAVLTAPPPAPPPPLSPILAPPPVYSAAPPPVYSAPPAAPVAAPPFYAAPPAAFHAPVVEQPTSPLWDTPQPASANPNVYFGEPQGPAEDLLFSSPAPTYSTAAEVLPSLPVGSSTNDATVWEAPSLVRFSPRSKVVVAQNPTSLAAEQYRVLRTNIVKLSQTQALKVILVTSPGPGDGKTLTTMNLALSFCQKPETRVLLIEADLRKPSVGALVAMDPGPGLSDYLNGESTLEQVVRPTSIPNFHLLDSGKRAAMPADLLHSPRLNSMMETLRSHFNWIVLDGPPTNPVADYELLTPICDGVVLVVRPFYTQRDLLRLTTEALRGRKVLGCVINGSKHFERYGSAYGYGYGYGPSNKAEPSDMSQRSRMRRKKKTSAGGE